MGSAVSGAVNKLTDDQKIEVTCSPLDGEFAHLCKWHSFFPQLWDVIHAHATYTREEKLEQVIDMFAAPSLGATGFSSQMQWLHSLANMNEQFFHVTNVMTLQSGFESKNESLSAGASHMFRDRFGRTERSVIQYTEDSRANKWRYKAGDTILEYLGKVAFTVLRPLGAGTFGEVHVVRDEGIRYDPMSNNLQQPIPKAELAMKCTKFETMSRENRIALFRPLCEEAILMSKIREHPHLLVLHPTS
jgi:hypothetical protein